MFLSAIKSFSLSRGSLCSVMLFVTFGMILLLPGVVTPELMHPTQTGKTFFFGLCLLVLGSIFVFDKLFISQKTHISCNWFDVSCLAWLAYISINRYLLQEIHGFSLKFYELLGLAVFYMILRGLNPKNHKWLLLGVIISGVAQATYGAFQLWGYYPSHHSGFKMTGSFFNPGPYSGFIAAVFPVALGVYLFRDKFPKINFLKTDKVIAIKSFVLSGSQLNTFIHRIIYEYLPLVCLLSMFLVLPASQSRAAWLAVIGSCTILLSVRYRSRLPTSGILNAPLKKNLMGLLLLMSVIAGGYGLYHFKQGSADGRLLIWRVTNLMISEHPWIGVGYDRFKANYMSYQADYFQINGETGEEWVAGDNYYPFNELLGFVAEQGVLGLIVLIVSIGVLSRLLIKNSLGYQSIIFLSGLISILIFSMFSYPGEIIPIKVYGV